MNNFKSGKLGRLMFLVVFLFLAVGCATNRSETRKLPDGYALYSNGHTYKWSNESGIDLETYYTKHQAVEAAWDSYIITRFFSPGSGEFKFVHETEEALLP